MQKGQTPFLAAAAMGHVDVASFLLDNGSSILERANVSDHHLLGLGHGLILAMQYAMWRPIASTAFCFTIRTHICQIAKITWHLRVYSYSWASL